MASAHELRIQLLGELSVFRDGQKLALPPSRKARALLAYLILTRRSHRRERLSALLWDVADDPRGALRWTLSRIRSIVDTEERRYIQADRESAGFDHSGVSVDIFDLRSVAGKLESASVEDLERCAAMARGELLEGLDFHEFDYQAWCTAERESTHQQRVAILRALNLRLRDDPSRALVAAQELVRAEPVDEQARIDLVGHYAAVGRFKEAENQLELAERAFRDLGVAPSRALREMGPKLRVARSAVPEQAASTRSEPIPRSPLARTTIHGLRLVGRKQEVQALSTRLDEAADQRRSSFILIHGEPGVGKSRMLVELMIETRKRGGAILEGGAYEAEGGRPYGPWIDAIRRLDSRLAQDPSAAIAPLFKSDLVVTESSQDGLFEGIAQLLIARAQGASFLLVAMDDLQWFDEASIRMLHYAARTTRKTPIVFVATARTGELRDNGNALRAVRGLRRESSMHEIELGPMVQDEIAALIGLVPNPWSAEDVFRESGGNPLFALEVVRSGAPIDGGLVPSIGQVVRDRVERLPPTCDEVLRWAAVLGPVFRVDMLEALVSVEPDQLASALEDLELHSLIGGVVDVSNPGNTYQFAHYIVHRVVSADLSLPRRRLMHNRVSKWLLERRADDDSVAAELAHHALEAGDLETAVEAAVRAVRHCLRVFARGQALGIAHRALRQTEGLPEALAAQRRTELVELIAQAEALPTPEALDHDADPAPPD